MGSRVLICDHERHIVRLLQVNLERMGWSVTPTFEGLEALARGSEGGYDSFILGAEMPDLNGLEITKRLRINPLTERAVILVVLDRADKELMSRAYQACADLVVTKPFDVRGLSLFLR
jgi:DNA-binding response OmpR family regulator